MRETFVEILNKTDITATACKSVVDDEALNRFALVAKNTRARLSYPDDLVLVALAGGTGSGKSSILNAVANEEVSDVGGVRPTTKTPLAIAEPGAARRMAGYMDGLGVRTRPIDGIPEWLVLIDLPDTDSVEADHRFLVESLVPVVDVVVWVTDPEKYKDAVLHDRFLQPLAPYAGHLLFVLNQSDRLADESVDGVLKDFASALLRDGFGDSQPMAMAANPTSAQGVDDLLSALAGFVDSRLGLYPKLILDLQQAVSLLDGDIGGAGVDFDRRIHQVIGIASAQIVDNKNRAASSTLTGFVEALGDETSGHVSEEIQAMTVVVPDLVLSVSESLQRAMVEHRRGRPSIRWSEKGDSMPQELMLGLVGEELKAGIEPSLREVLRRRATAIAALADLSMSLASAAFGPQ
jgi:hypothetical protein